MKPYKITEVKELGEYKKRIHLTEKGVNYLDITFSYEDERKSIRIADKIIIEKNLDFATKILKKK